ncbi:conserved hypothetical protein, partial [Ricinus communis]
MTVRQVQPRRRDFPRAQLDAVACIERRVRRDARAALVAEVIAVTLAVDPLCADIGRLAVARHPCEARGHDVLRHEYQFAAGVRAVREVRDHVLQVCTRAPAGSQRGFGIDLEALALRRIEVRVRAPAAVQGRIIKNLVVQAMAEHAGRQRAAVVARRVAQRGAQFEVVRRLRLQDVGAGTVAVLVDVRHA